MLIMRGKKRANEGKRARERIDKCHPHPNSNSRSYIFIAENDGRADVDHLHPKDDDSDEIYSLCLSPRGAITGQCISLPYYSVPRGWHKPLIFTQHAADSSAITKCIYCRRASASKCAIQSIGITLAATL